MRQRKLYKKAWPAVEPPELKGAYVGFWARLVALLLDIILIKVVTYPFLIAVYGWGYLESWTLVDGPFDLVVSWMFPAAAIVAFWMYCAATPGKMVIGAQVVDAVSGRHPTPWQFFKRYIGYFPSAILLCWGFIRAAFDPRKQGWHDKFAGTVVVYVKKVRIPELAATPQSSAANQSFQMFQSYCVEEEDNRKAVVSKDP